MMLQSTSSGVPAVPVLLVAAAAFIAFSPAAGSAAVENVVWTNIVNSTATGNSLQKSAGCDGCDDAGATSQQQITSGGGYVEFTVGDATKFFFAGLSDSNNTVTAYSDIDFAFRLNGAGSADVMENGVYRGGDTSYIAGDVFRVAVVAGQVQYSKNGTLLYTSSQSPTYPVLLDSSLLSLGSTVVNAKISFAGGSGAAPGGFIEKADNPATRPRFTPEQITAFLPPGGARGPFTFPAPYNTEGIRITNNTDCPAADDPSTPLDERDCVHHVGYSYWRNINNHTAGDTMYIFLGLNKNLGGAGPTLFSYNKVTGQVTNGGALFPFDLPDERFWYNYLSGEGWYFSATMPTKLYVLRGPKLSRYDVETKALDTLFDVNTQCPQPAVCPAPINPTYGLSIDQAHSSDDDRVHSATLKDTPDNDTYRSLGCVVYFSDTQQFQFYAKLDDHAFNECHLDKSGRWLILLEDYPESPPNNCNPPDVCRNDNRVVDLQAGSITFIEDAAGNGALGHLDMGFGYAVGADNYDPKPNANILRTFADPLPPPSGVVQFNKDWNTAAANHVAHGNAKPGTPPEEQYACGSNADVVAERANEIICFRLTPDENPDILVVAQVMTEVGSTDEAGNRLGGGYDRYAQFAHGNVDVTGQYFIWTSNLGSGRLDAFIVKVPGQCLYRSPQQEGPC